MTLLSQEEDVHNLVQLKSEFSFPSNTGKKADAISIIGKWWSVLPRF